MLLIRYAGGFWRPSRRLEHVCAARRPAPLLPEAAASLLQSSKAFSNTADAQTVSEVYRHFFEAVAGSAATLEFATLGWGVAEAAALALALPRFSSLTSLDVSHNAIGPEGAKALGPTLGRMPRLSELNLSECGLGAEGAAAIAAALGESTSLASVHLAMNVGRSRRLARSCH